MTFCYWKLRHEQEACMRVVFLSTTSSNLVIHVSSAEFLHLVYFPYTLSKTSAIHRTRTLIEAWCCCCWQIYTSLTLSPLPLLTQNFSRIWKDHPEVRRDKAQEQIRDTAAVFEEGNVLGLDLSHGGNQRRGPASGQYAQPLGQKQSPS